MGQSNSTTVQTYIDNSTEIRSAVELNIKNGARTELNNSNTNSVSLGIGSLSDCCGAFADIPAKGNLTDEEYQVLLNNNQKALQQCQESARQVRVECNLDINQSIISKISVSQAVTSQSNAELINSIMNEIENKVEEVVKQKNDAGLLSTIQSASSDSDIINNVNNSIRADLSAGLNVQTQSNIRAVSGQNNNSNILFCAGTFSGNSCRINQSTSIETYIDNIVHTVADIVSNNLEAQQIASVAKTTQQQENTNFISDFFNSLSGFVKVIIAAIGGFILVALLLGVVVVLRGVSHHPTHGSALRASGYNYSVKK